MNKNHWPCKNAVSTVTVTIKMRSEHPLVNWKISDNISYAGNMVSIEYASQKSLESNLCDAHSLVSSINVSRFSINLFCNQITFLGLPLGLDL